MGAMRLALIADIHGNLPALDRVLADLAREDVDQIVCLGDVAVGPQPVETLDRVQALGCPTVMGNWDACLLGAETQLHGEIAEMLADVCAWSAAQISPAQREYVRTFKDTHEVRLDENLTMLCFHGSPRSFNDYIYATTSDDELETMFAGYEADVFAGAHTHFQMFRRLGECVVVNAGSVGQPFRALADRDDAALALGRVLHRHFERGKARCRAAASAARRRCARRDGARRAVCRDAERWASLWTPELVR